MATLTTHLLDSVRGTHAGGVGVRLFRLEPGGARALVFDRTTDTGGRLAVEIGLSDEHAEARFEMVVASGAYFDAQRLPAPARQILEEIVVRFSMPDGQAGYHIPMMLAPNSYSVWWSS